MFDGLMGDDIYVDGYLVGRLNPGVLLGLREELEDRLTLSPEDVRNAEDQADESEREAESLAHDLQEANEKIDDLEAKLTELRNKKPKKY